MNTNNTNLILINGFSYDMSSPTSDDFTKKTISAFGDTFVPTISVDWYHLEGFQLFLNSEFDEEFNVEIFDNSDKLLFKTILRNGMFCKLNRQYFNGIKFRITWNGTLLKEEIVSFEGKRVAICLDSMSLGDTLAWLPYCEEFSIVHNCQVVVTTFMNDLFVNQYPNLSFSSPGSVMYNLFGLFKLGWFYDKNLEPELPNTIPLQKVATNILGLPFKEIRPKLDFDKTTRPIEKKYVTIGMTTTSGCKEWSYENGWQTLINELTSRGFEVAVIQKEPLIPNITGVLDWTGDYLLQTRMSQIYHSEFYIGLGSGLSWLAWAVHKHVVMISNFSEDGHEFTHNTTRITNKSVCNGCWNNPMFKFDKGDWYWCPEHKGTERQFECQVSITPQMVIDKIQHLIR